MSQDLNAHAEVLPLPSPDDEMAQGCLAGFKKHFPVAGRARAGAAARCGQIADSSPFHCHS